MTDPHPEELILRYLTGKLSGDAALRARSYLDGTARRRLVGIGLRHVMAAEVLERGCPDVQTSLARLLDRLDRAIPHLPDKLVDGVDTTRLAVSLPRSAGTVRTGGSEPRRGLLGRQTPRGGTWYTLAGAALVVLALVVGWHVDVLRLRGHRSVPMAVYATGNGQRASITLTDGTTIALGVASRLEVSADYPAGDHTVRLRGEAAFTVARHTGMPFTVLAGLATARVLGTSFLVRHYPTDRLTTVVVRDGKVAVRTAVQPPMVLAAAQQVMIGGAGAVGVQAADLAQFNFAAGTLTLNDMPLPEAIPELDRWYDADIRVADARLNNHQITGEYAAGSLADLADILELTFKVRVVRHGRVLTLFLR